MHTHSEQEQSKNTYIVDSESATEMVRLTKQDRLVTKYMRGLLPAQARPDEMKDVLDLACGPGGWVLECAFAYPHIRFTGVDISRICIDYARASARTQMVDNNTTFKVMDVTKPLDFPDATFDFVNARFLSGLVLPHMWAPLIKESIRVTKPGGLIRLTETDDMGNTNSPAFEKLFMLATRAFKLAGRSFSPEARNGGLTPMLGRFLRDAGCKHIDTQAYAIDFSSGMEAHDSLFEDWMAGLKLLQPFMLKMEIATETELEELYQTALAEMLSDDFCGLWTFISVVAQTDEASR